jgi:hypothetical protein
MALQIKKRPEGRFLLLTLIDPVWNQNLGDKGPTHWVPTDNTLVLCMQQSVEPQSAFWTFVQSFPGYDVCLHDFRRSFTAYGNSGLSNLHVCFYVALVGSH